MHTATRNPARHATLAALAGAVLSLTNAARAQTAPPSVADPATPPRVEQPVVEQPVVEQPLAPALQALRVDRVLDALDDGQRRQVRISGWTLIGAGLAAVGVGVAGVWTSTSTSWTGVFLDTLPFVVGGLVIGLGTFSAARPLRLSPGDLHYEYRVRLRTGPPDEALRWLEVQLERGAATENRSRVLLGLSSAGLAALTFTLQGLSATNVFGPNNGLTTAVYGVLGTVSVGLSASIFLGENVSDRTLRLLRAGQLLPEPRISVVPWVSPMANSGVSAGLAATF